MENFWTLFNEFWQVYGPWIATGLIPTILVGLTKSPSTEPAAGWVQKIWDLIKMVMDWLSVVTHKDAPGTFQLPLKLSNVVKKDMTGPVIALLMAGALSTQINCGGWLGNVGSETKRVGIDCSTESARTNASQLLPAILAILNGAPANWKDQVKMFVKEFGRDTAACAVQVAMQKLERPIMSEAEGESSMESKAAAERAKLFIAEQNWSFIQ